MELEIVFKDNLIYIHAGWFWCVLFAGWAVLSIIAHGLNIYTIHLQAKLRNLEKRGPHGKIYE